MLASHYHDLAADLRAQDNPALADALPQLLSSGLDVSRYGDIPRWHAALEALPEVDQVSLQADQSVVSLRSEESVDQDALREALMGLHPWRKGPFDLFGVAIDTEWRSDFKWDRLAGSIDSLAGRRVLDVGCGSGYHCWRMLAESAEFVLGIDPTPLFVYQFWALQRYAQRENIWVIPARLEALPPKMQAFETVFSMGVLYHRRSPFDHLQELREALAEGGQLVLETLVIEGGEGDVLVPESRYSMMGNVWFIPSAAELMNWLKKMKFRDIELIDVCATSTNEQRSTDWMRFHSLGDFLDQADPSKTVEGYPAPRRAIVSARR